MKLSEVTAAAAAILATSPALGAVPRLFAHAGDYAEAFETALSTSGRALVIVYVAGRLTDPTRAVLRFEHDLLIGVVENTAKNVSGVSALQTAEQVCELFHQRSAAAKGQDTWTLDDPAIEPGPPAQKSGLLSWLVTLRVLSLQSVNPAV